MLSNFLRIQRAKHDGYTFTKIRFGESTINGRCTYGATREDVLDYYQEDDVINICTAWQCHHRNHPTIKSFGLTKSDCLNKLKKALKYVKSF